MKSLGFACVPVGRVEADVNIERILYIISMNYLIDGGFEYQRRFSIRKKLRGIK